jgi:hypothetical protein
LVLLDAHFDSRAVIIEMAVARSPFHAVATPEVRIGSNHPPILCLRTYRFACGS